MAIAGWSRTDMLVRYTKARASERAVQEAWKLNLGDLQHGTRATLPDEIVL